MSSVQKETKSASQLRELIESAVNHRPSLAEISFAIKSIDDNDRGENFEVVILDEAEIDTIQKTEFIETVAPILGIYALI
jgi:hypothetical protein